MLKYLVSFFLKKTATPLIQKVVNKVPPQIVKQPAFKSRFGFSKVDKSLKKLSKPIYLYLIGLNLGVYTMWNLPFDNRGQNFMYNHLTISKANIQEKRYHTLVTHSFSHFDTGHLLVNMVTLFFFGRSIEAYFGPKRLLFCYLLGALLGGGVSAYRDTQLPYERYTLGASGAVNAVLTYFICNFPKEVIYLYFWPVPSWILGILLLVQNYFMIKQDSNAYESHLGGVVGGFLYFLLTKRRL